MSGLSGTVVVIGAASGIGRATCELILERDPNATVVGIDLGPIKPMSRGRPDAFVSMTADVAEPTQVGEVFGRIAAEYRPLRGLVCAAGILHRKPSQAVSPDEWHRMLGVHLDGTFFACQQARSHMAPGAAIVAFSSVAEAFGWPERAAYAAAKSAVSSLTRSLAVEWAAAGIRVNCVAPGYVDTPLIEQARGRGDLSTEPSSLHAQGRLAQVSEVAAPVRFLLSDDASFITGETLFVDGGYRVFKGA